MPKITPQEELANNLADPKALSTMQNLLLRYEEIRNVLLQNGETPHNMLLISEYSKYWYPLLIFPAKELISIETVSIYKNQRYGLILFDKKMNFIYAQESNLKKIYQDFG